MLIVLTMLSCSNRTNQPNTSKQVTSIHQIELKESIDPNEFEKYVLTVIAPIYNRIEGQLFSQERSRLLPTIRYAAGQDHIVPTHFVAPVGNRSIIVEIISCP